MKTFTLSALMMAISHVSATYTYIAGYEPQSDVMQHNRIDLDLEEIMSTHLPEIMEFFCPHVLDRNVIGVETRII